MNVIVVSRAFDTGGQGWRISEAFRKHAGWVVRSMAKIPTYLAYPVDLPFRWKHLEELYQSCDVFHARNDFRIYDQLASKFGPKPVVIHYHGTSFRGDANRRIAEQRKRGAIGLVSTLDLYLLAPDDLEWMPAPYDVDWLAAMR